MVRNEVFPAPGEHVLVPWGLEEVLGEVLEVYPSGLGDRAVVRLLGGSDPDATVTVPADILTPVSGPTRGIAPRIEAMEFESQVHNALSQAAGDMHLALNDQRLDDRGIDALITDGRHQIAVQVKYFTSNRLHSDAISAVAAYARSVRPVIIIANAGLTLAARERLERLNQPKRSTWFLRWTGASDYSRLRDAIREALAATGNR